MISAIIPENETLRLRDLHNSGLLDTPQEDEFDEIVKFASTLCNMPISLISLVDSNRQWFKARIGLDAVETNREVSFCSHAILQDQLFEIRDTLVDNRFMDNPLVINDPSIRFYAGMPLVTKSGSRLGTLCVIDKLPGKLTEKQRLGLRVLANNVIKIAELRIKNKELHYMSETQKKIISILAHDVRNPLVSIKNVIELTQSEVLDVKETAEVMEMVTSQVNSTLEMVENIVGWGMAHLQFGGLQLDDFDLYELVEGIFGAEKLKSAAKGNELINEVEPGTLIHSDIRTVEFILRNLIGNSNKFTQGGIVKVSAQPMGIKTTIWVTDTGVGMKKEKAAELFKNSNTSTTLGTNKEKGSGLGLMLVKEFIDRLDGTITVDSKVGKGTSFKIDI